MAILTSSSLLLDELPEGDPRRGEALEIRIAAERAASLTRQLLAFLRSQALERQLIDLNALVMGVEKMLRRLIGANIELSTSFAEGLGLIEVPPGQMEQVIVNLVINARDAMPSGGKLRIETSEVEDATAGNSVAGKQVMLSISDTGVGMSPETQRHLFEPFYTTKPQGKGTGLGLFTSQAIVTRSGGSIAVESHPGAGTVFKIFLPLATREARAGGSRGAPEEIARGSETVLLVEDDEQLRGVVQRVLEQNGYRVLAARDSAEAMEISDSFAGEVQLVLTDVVLPGLSGPELVERLRIERSSLHALYMSGYPEPSDPVKSDLDPTVNLIEKPFAPDEILRRVRRALDAR